MPVRDKRVRQRQSRDMSACFDYLVYVENKQSEQNQSDLMGFAINYIVVLARELKVTQS